MLIALQGINELRERLAEPSIEILFRSRESVEEHLNDELQRRFDLATNGLRDELKDEKYSLSALSAKEQADFITTVAIYANPDATRPEDEAFVVASSSQIEENGAISDFQFYSILVLCAESVVSKGNEFLRTLEDENRSQMLESRAQLFVALAHYDLLISYFTILVERREA